MPAPKRSTNEFHYSVTRETRRLEIIAEERAKAAYLAETMTGDIAAKAREDYDRLTKQHGEVAATVERLKSAALGADLETAEAAKRRQSVDVQAGRQALEAALAERQAIARAVDLSWAQFVESLRTLDQINGKVVEAARPLGVDARVHGCTALIAYDGYFARSLEAAGLNDKLHCLRANAPSMTFKTPSCEETAATGADRLRGKMSMNANRLKAKG